MICDNCVGKLWAQSSLLETDTNIAPVWYPYRRESNMTSYLNKRIGSLPMTSKKRHIRLVSQDMMEAMYTLDVRHIMLRYVHVVR